MSIVRMCTSSSNVFSWKISLEDWTKDAVGGRFHLPFETMVPPGGRRIKWNLVVCPKGLDIEGTKFVGVYLFIADVSIDLDIDTEYEIGQFQIETAYRIRHAHSSGPLDMSSSRSFSSFHSNIFKTGHNVQWLVDSYEAGSVEDRAVEGNLTLDFEIRTYEAPCMKFQFSGSKDEFVKNFESVDRASGDVKIICGGEEYSCHKFLLMSQSPVFKAMFEMDSIEAKENVVNIVDSTQEAVLSFVSYLYNGILRLGRYYSKDLEHIFGLLNLANKYQVQLLLDSCMDALMNIMDVDNVLKIMAVVDKFDLGSTITDMVIEFMKKNIRVIVDQEDWAAFHRDYPSLVKDFIINMNEDMVQAKDVANRVANM